MNSVQSSLKSYPLWVTLQLSGLLWHKHSKYNTSITAKKWMTKNISGIKIKPKSKPETNQPIPGLGTLRLFWNRSVLERGPPALDHSVLVRSFSNHFIHVPFYVFLAKERSIPFRSVLYVLIVKNGFIPSH